LITFAGKKGKRDIRNNGGKEGGVNQGDKQESSIRDYSRGVRARELPKMGGKKWL